VSDDAKARDKGLSIQILGREYRVACPEGEERQLQASVDYLNRRMKDLRDNGRVTGNERIAIMAALNIAHEFLSQKPAKSPASSVDGADYRRRIAAMQETLDSALAADQDKLF
jgi:cell division protein ZapA